MDEYAPGLNAICLDPLDRNNVVDTTDHLPYIHFSSLLQLTRVTCLILSGTWRTLAGGGCRSGWIPSSLQPG